MSPLVHSELSVKSFGGKLEDYLEIHEFLDMTKTHYVGYQHRAILHNTFGIYICERIFGPYITNSDGNKVETRYIVINHIKEDLSFVPTVKEWVSGIPFKPWMNGETIAQKHNTKNIETLLNDEQ
jgi:hypothetical protein